MGALTEHDWKRVREILGLTNDAYSKNTSAEIRWARYVRDTFGRDRSHGPAAMRRRLARIERAGRELVKSIDAIPRDAPERGLLLAMMSGTGGLESIRTHVDMLAHYCEQIIPQLPKVRHRPDTSSLLYGHVRMLERHFRGRTGRCATSTPGSAFSELVSLVLGIDDPTKLIQATFRAPPPPARLPPPDFTVTPYGSTEIGKKPRPRGPFGL
jgi:hypothetical protein